MPLHLAGSGGAACDHEGRLVAVNSFVLEERGMQEERAYLRMVSELREEHGFIKRSRAAQQQH